MERNQVRETLEEIDGLRADVRRRLQSFWFPLVLYGALTLVSSLVCSIGDGTAMAVFWALAAPAGGLATGAYYARREAALGLSRPAAPYIAVAAALVVGAFGLAMLTSGDLQDVAPSLAVAAGYLGFAWIERDVRIAGVAAVLAIVPLVILAVSPGAACEVAAAVTGSVLLVSGLWIRSAQRIPTAGARR